MFLGSNAMSSLQDFWTAFEMISFLNHMQAKNLGSSREQSRKSQYMLKEKLFSYKQPVNYLLKKAICWLEKGIAAFSLFRIVSQELLMQQSPSNSAE